jgi:hypothetical protein
MKRIETILIVDDSITNLNFLRVILEEKVMKYWKQPMEKMLSSCWKPKNQI